MENGTMSASGSFKELEQVSYSFRKLVELAFNK